MSVLPQTNYGQNPLSPGNQNTNVPATPDLTYSPSPSGSTDLEIYPCSSLPTSLGLNGYQAAGSVVISGVSNDLSGVTYNALTNTLFMVINGSTTMLETELNGNILRTISLSGFEDTEGVAHLYDNTFAVTEERRGNIVIFELSASQTLVNYSQADIIEFANWQDGTNKGLEGVSYDLVNQLLYAVKEKQNMELYKLPVPSNYPITVTPNIPCALSTLPITDVADLYLLSAPSGYNAVGIEDHMLLLSDESTVLMELDANCNIVSQLDLSGLPQPEGITLSANGDIYIVSEPNILYKYTKSTAAPSPIYSATNLTGTSHTVTSSNLVSNEAYCWRVKDSNANSWSDFWSFSVNTPPSVAITAPLNGTITDPNIQINADASDTDGTIAQVDFYVNAQLVGTDNSYPFSINHTLNQGDGLYIIDAIATDDDGASTAASRINIVLSTVTYPPSVAITSPQDGDTFSPDTNIPLIAMAEDTDGSIQHVEFFIGNQLYFIDDEYPFETVWTPSTPGAYTLSAVALDDDGQASNSFSLTINVEYDNTITSSSQISSGEDDVEEFANGNMYSTSSDLELNQETNRGEQTVGLRFQNLGLPSNAVISSAYLQFTTDNETNSEATTCIIKGEATSDAQPFTSANGNLTSRQMTAASVSWSIDPWLVNYESGAAQRSPNIAPILQEIVNTYGFNPGSAIVLAVDGTSGQRIAVSYNKNPQQAAELIVNYNCPEAGLICDDGDPNTINTLTDGECGCIPEEPISMFFDIQINSGNNDVEENGRNGRMYNNSSDIELVRDRSYTGNQIIGLRYEQIYLPSSAVITNAYIQFTVDETRNRQGTVVISGEASSNSSPFTTSAYNVSSRNQTNAATSWAPAPWLNVGDAGEAQRSPDLSPIIQEIISSTGWSPGNAMTFIIEGNGKRVAESYEGSPDKAAVLHIEYTLSNSNIDFMSNTPVASDDNEPTEQRQAQTGIKNINLYPNPAAYEVNILMEFEQIDSEQGTISLYDYQGKLLVQESFNPIIDRGLDLDVEHLPGGTYIIQIQAGEYFATQQFIKQ